MLNYKCGGSEAWSHTPSLRSLQCGWFIDVIWHAGQTHAQMYQMYTHTVINLPSSEMVPPSFRMCAYCYAREGLALQCLLKTFWMDNTMKRADISAAKIMSCQKAFDRISNIKKN